MATHIHIHIRDQVFSRTSLQTVSKMAAEARRGKREEAEREKGNIYRVQRKQKNGKLAPPDQFSVNLSKEDAERRKASLEKMNPGSTYEIHT